MSIPLQVCLNKVSVAKLVTNTVPVPIAPKTTKVAPYYGCFTTVAVCKDGSEWVVQNMPIHRWLLDKVFNECYLEEAGVTVATTKQYQRIPKALAGAPIPIPKTNQSSTATIPVIKAARGSKARQGKRIKFGLSGTSATSLLAAITAGSAPKSFGKQIAKSTSVLMPARCTNPQIGAWFSTHMLPARLVDIVGGQVYRENGTAIGVKDVSLPAEFVKQFADITATAKAKLQPRTEAPVVMY